MIGYIVDIYVGQVWNALAADKLLLQKKLPCNWQTATERPPNLIFLNLRFSLVFYSSPLLPKKNLKRVYTKLFPNPAKNRQTVTFIFMILTK